MDSVRFFDIFMLAVEALKPELSCVFSKSAYL